MNAAEIAEQAIEKMETDKGGNANDKPAEPKDTATGKPGTGGDDSKQPDTAKDDKPAEPEKPQYDKDGKRVESTDEKKEDEAGDKKTDDKEEGEFTADDAVEEEIPEAKEVTPTDSAGVALSTAEQKYITEHIGEIGKAVRFSGTINGKEAAYEVYDVSQLPANFEPDNIVTFNQGLKTLDTMARKAEQLLGQYRQQQSQQSAVEFEKRENEAIRQDVADLQKDGDFPKFRVQPGTSGFDEDPAAQQMAEVLGVMSERNEQYLKEYQQGRAYRHIGFREAFEIWQSRQNVTKAKTERDTAQKEEDKERKRTSDRVGTNRGLTTAGVVRPTVRPGTTIEQILARHEQEL